MQRSSLQLSFFLLLLTLGFLHPSILLLMTFPFRPFHLPYAPFNPAHLRFSLILHLSVYPSVRRITYITVDRIAHLCMVLGFLSVSVGGDLYLYDDPIVLRCDANRCQPWMACKFSKIHITYLHNESRSITSRALFPLFQPPNFITNFFHKTKWNLFQKKVA